MTQNCSNEESKKDEPEPGNVYINTSDKGQEKLKGDKIKTEKKGNVEGGI